jgi:acyl-CoA synthetase (AMP-forming)/AMP-acid ligase II
MASIGNWPRFDYMERTKDGWRQTSIPDAEFTGRAGGRLNNLREMDVKVIDSDTGKDLPHGMDHSGELCLRGPQISDSYLNNPAATEKSRMPADPKDPDQRIWWASIYFS